MDMVVKRFDVWLINLEPTLGSEISKTRPCLVISPDVVNNYLNTITVAAMTSTIKTYPTRVTCVFQERHGQVALDQIRSVDKIRFIKKLGIMDKRTCGIICDVLAEYSNFNTHLLNKVVFEEMKTGIKLIRSMPHFHPG